MPLIVGWRHLFIGNLLEIGCCSWSGCIETASPRCYSTSMYRQIYNRTNYSCSSHFLDLISFLLKIFDKYTVCLAWCWCHDNMTNLKVLFSFRPTTLVAALVVTGHTCYYLGSISHPLCKHKVQASKRHSRAVKLSSAAVNRNSH